MEHRMQEWFHIVVDMNMALVKVQKELKELKGLNL